MDGCASSGIGRRWRQKVEFITTSAGSAQGRDWEDLDAWSGPKEDTSDEVLFEFHNTLLIRRRNDVAYQRSLGLILKSAWERGDTEFVDVTLG